ncbi:hypothetical protein B0H16DRAFT_1469916 [Mycena metata]|uniref:RRM domain-containing protein n=1 Tax=Mycena metata TaxID=1033252 RepID=A0AAD7HWD5_9AGAR|nr:hypothetical protein B0H16DRAFT_1469916 [Mycena metata]
MTLTVCVDMDINSPTAGPPHPFLVAPTLFVGNLPSHVLEKHIKVLFQAPYMTASVSFSPNTEKALAILHLRPILSLEPEAILNCFAAADFKPFDAPDASIAPRLIRPLPPGCTESDLFDMLRPYGPIYYVRIHPIAGGLVQFWVEAHARNAEIGLAKSQPKMIIGAYDPCSLFCSNISFGLDETVLRSHFVEFGNIRGYPHTHKSRGVGIITFSLASEASQAMEAMHGVEIEWRALSLTYRIIRRKDDATESHFRLQTIKPTEPTAEISDAKDNIDSSHCVHHQFVVIQIRAVEITSCRQIFTHCPNAVTSSERREQCHMNKTQGVLNGGKEKSAKQASSNLK